MIQNPRSPWILPEVSDVLQEKKQTEKSAATNSGNLGRMPKIPVFIGFLSQTRYLIEPSAGSDYEVVMTSNPIIFLQQVPFRGVFAVKVTLIFSHFRYLKDSKGCKQKKRRILIDGSHCYCSLFLVVGVFLSFLCE